MLVDVVEMVQRPLDGPIASQGVTGDQAQPVAERRCWRLSGGTDMPTEQPDAASGNAWTDDRVDIPEVEGEEQDDDNVDEGQVVIQVRQGFEAAMIPRHPLPLVAVVEGEKQL